MADRSMYIEDDTRPAGEQTTDTAFEEEMRIMVSGQFSGAKDFLRGFHTQCVDRYEAYNNGRSYDDLKEKNEFPVPFVKKQVDRFVVYSLDKLYWKNEPCTIVGTEEADREDAKVKQELMKFQDKKDKMYSKIKKSLRDMGLYGVGIVQTDWEDSKTKKVVGEDQEQMMIDPTTSLPITHPETGEPIPQADKDGNPVTVRDFVTKDVIKYLGPKVKRVDPLNFFFGRDKRSMDDDCPIMIRSFVPWDFFDNDDNFINTDQLKGNVKQFKEALQEGSSPAEEDGNLTRKRMIRGFDNNAGDSKNECEYVEWQGPLDRQRLYEYTGQDTEGPDGVSLITPGEKVWAILGMVNEAVMVRIEETPFEMDGPNVVLGTILEDDDELIGEGIGDMVQHVQKALDVAMGMTLENLKQSVNAGHVIKTNSLRNGVKAVVNKPGFIIETTDDVNTVHKRIEQPRVSIDLYTLMEIFTNMGEEASMVAPILGAQGDPSADTLGESTMMQSNAEIGMNGYLKSVEDTFIQPLWEMRNHFNIVFLEEDYVYQVVGDIASGWRTATPDQIRANVDFTCESSARETRRNIITQQILQLAKIAPLVQEMGMPVRLDVLIGQLCEQGFGWSKEMVNKILPSLKLEDEGIVDINKILMQNLLMGAAQDEEGMASSGAGGGGRDPAPTSEEGAVASANQKNSTKVGRV